MTPAQYARIAAAAEAAAADFPPLTDAQREVVVRLLARTPNPVATVADLPNRRKRKTSPVRARSDRDAA